MHRSLPTLLAVSFLARAHAATPVDFATQIRPLFEKHCTECHGEKKQKAGLRLDIKAAAFKGGDNHGAALIPGNPEKSPLMELVRSNDPDERMPPKGKGLTPEESALLATWIEQGAQWPDGIDKAKLEDKRDHWSFKPLSNPTPPSVQRSDWPKNPADQFILAQLEKENLAPSPEADRATWLRRVTFDLTGLAPSPEELADFHNDHAPDAYSRVVDRLLGSPRYGERWAQHWLDVVRYADTHGFEVNTERPNAWPYRDYVIRALNDDVPYDRFIREQIHGDSLQADAATGFLVTASVLLPGQIGADDASKRLARQDSLDEILVNVSQTFLGLSIGCARCHDHKFDPVTHHDYYALQSFFAGVHYADRPLQTPEAKEELTKAKAARDEAAQIDKKITKLFPRAFSGTPRQQVFPDINFERFNPIRGKKLKFTITETNKLEPCIDELEVFNTGGANVALASSGAKTAASGSIIVADRHDLRHLNDGLYGNSRSWMGDQVSGSWVTVDFLYPQTIERVVWARDREEKFRDRLATQYKIEVLTLDEKWVTVADSTDRAPFNPEARSTEEFSSKNLAALTKSRTVLLAEAARRENVGKVFGGTFEKPDEIRVLARGNPEQPKELVSPAVPAIFEPVQIQDPANESERRKALAAWIASPRNPLTARVLVNRVWQWHFGTGLVPTPSDFGRSGIRPSHPELLDWLANTFIRENGSLKSLHRHIVLSATYRQSSTTPQPAAQQKDADCRLLWRFPGRRLDAESIRDSMLQISGILNPAMYGTGFNLFHQRGGLSGFIPVETFSPTNLRRMIYAHKVRRERDAVFGAFDCPDGAQSTALRRESTTPIQALNLFNSAFTLHSATAMAQRIEKEIPADPAAATEKAFQLALSRVPTPVEKAQAIQIAQTHGLATLCRVLFNTNEFVSLP
jgi:mono/diheme cytochrome c family protein